MSGKVVPQPNEVWENIFDLKRVTIIKVKYDIDWDCNCVKYVKEGTPTEMVKPVNLFLSSYKILS